MPGGCKLRPYDISEHLSWEDLTKALHYDSETGVFTKRALTKHQKERVAGSNSGSEYTRICLNRKSYFAHRLAWYYVTGSPPMELIDHINGDKRDNRFCNLRSASYSQNAMNSKINSVNKSGCKGVSWRPARKKWVAVAKLDGRKIHLGYYTDFNDAKKAYCDFASKHHGEFLRSK